MVDYYTVISRAVLALPNNTAEARQTLYERARAALIDSLTGQAPPIAESDIERERLALEEGIRRVEDEAFFNEARELQTKEASTQSSSTAELASSIKVERSEGLPFGTPDANQIEHEPHMVSSMSKRFLDKFRTVDLTLFCLSSLISLSLAGLTLALGSPWIANRIVDNLIFVIAAALILCAVGLLPIRWPRPMMTIYVYVFLISSYLFGITTWLVGVVTTFQYWGWLGLSIGLCLGVVGVIPLGMVASALHSDWVAVVVILVGILVTYGARDMARERALEQGSPTRRQLIWG